jgi:hypothetical protein
MNSATLRAFIVGHPSEEEKGWPEVGLSVGLVCLCTLLTALSFACTMDFVGWCSAPFIAFHPRRFTFLWMDHPYWFFIGGTFVINLLVWVGRWADPEIFSLRMRYWGLLCTPGFVGITCLLCFLNLIRIMLDGLFSWLLRLMPKTV